MSQPTEHPEDLVHSRLRATAAGNARVFQQEAGFQFNADKLTVQLATGPHRDTIDIEFPRVSDLDPLDVGVHRASSEFGLGLPPYVERDKDRQLNRAFEFALRSGGLVLLVGDSTAGKSRSAFECLTRLAPTRRFFHPDSTAALRDSVLSLISQAREVVVWLDDFDNYLFADDFTVSLITGLKAAGVPMLATMRGEQFRRLNVAPADHGHARDNSAASRFRKVLSSVAPIMVSRRWSKAEVLRAQESADRRIQQAASQASSFGIAEYVAAGPRLLEDWQTAWTIGGNPRAAALVAAAVDLSRTGIAGYVGRDVLTSLHEVYLEAEGGSLVDPESLEDAYEWATTRRYGAASLLLSEDGSLRVRAFDYLADSASRQDAEPVKDEAWEASLQVALDDPQWLYPLGLAAESAERWETAEAAWQALGDSGNSVAALNLGRLYRRQRRLEQAALLFRRTADLGNPEGLTFLAILSQGEGDEERAVELYREAAEAGSTHAAFHLAWALRARGGVEEAERWFRFAATDGSNRSNASGHLADLLAETGRIDEGVQIYRDSLAAGDESARVGLGLLLIAQGNEHAGVRELRAAVSAGDAAAMRALGVHLRDTGESEAERILRQAIDKGAVGARTDLAILYAERGESVEAEELFRDEVANATPMSELNLIVFLRGEGRDDEAIEVARTAVHAEVPGSHQLLAAMLDERGETDEALPIWQVAAQSGDEQAIERLAEAAVKNGDFDEAERLLTGPAEAGSPILSCDLAYVLERAGRHHDAERWYRFSLAAGHGHAGCRFGNYLVRNKDLEGAARAYLSAYEAGHDHVSSELAVVLARLGRGVEAAHWLSVSQGSARGRQSSHSKRRPNRRGKASRNAKSKRKRRR